MTWSAPWLIVLGGVGARPQTSECLFSSSSMPLQCVLLVPQAVLEDSLVHSTSCFFFSWQPLRSHLFLALSFLWTKSQRLVQCKDLQGSLWKHSAFLSQWRFFFTTVSGYQNLVNAMIKTDNNWWVIYTLQITAGQHEFSFVCLFLSTSEFLFWLLSHFRGFLLAALLLWTKKWQQHVGIMRHLALFSIFHV